MTTTDLAKRRRVMQRSLKLGHCICDPKRPCPCEIFKDEGICPCAGERPEPISFEKIKLTEMVHNPGCASKIPAVDLERALKRLVQPKNPRVLSGIESGDDAGIYALNDNTTLVQTVDVFTPCVDDPETFGRICAANCLSDIYAMGAVPHTALSILCFPIETVDSQVMYLMMKGAQEVFNEAGVAVIGGHSVKDNEIKLGFAITGTVDKEKALEHNNAQVGDILIITKKLGTGVLNFAKQINRASAEGLIEAEKSMMTLNRAAAEAIIPGSVSSATDITGFGLYGHLVSMARTSEITAQVWADKLPTFPGVIEAFAQEIIPGACERNREFVADDIRISPNVPKELTEIGFDAQTSGGLLLSVRPQYLDALLESMKKHQVPTWIVGKVTDKSRGLISITLACENAEDAGEFSDHEEDLPRSLNAKITETKTKEKNIMPNTNEPSITAAASLNAFNNLMHSMAADGAIDSKTKEMITLALAAVTRCEPCFKIHLQAASKMGISEAQINEIIWQAVAMGGAPVRMFCKQAMDELNFTNNNNKPSSGGTTSCC